MPNSSKEERTIEETKLIKFYKELGFEIYNFKEETTRTCYSLTPEETRQKQSESHKDKKQSEETKEKRSIIFKQKWQEPIFREKMELHLKKLKSFNTGKKRSNETKQKISQNRKGKMTGETHHMYGKTHTIEVKEKISQSLNGQTGMESRRAKVYDLSLNPLVSPTGEIFTKIECSAEFARLNNLRPQDLHRVIIGKRKSCKGWKLI